ncbi:MAG: ATP-binding protein [Ignavibacteriales bacterium]|nr:ATP-binding protein [Ignavibacteriales bacterium]
MVNIIQTWPQEIAEDWFKQIEEDASKREFVSLEWKQEFKFDDTNSDGSNNTTQKSISSFANTHGGFIIIGITNNKQIIGIESSSVDYTNIENFILDKITRKLNPLPDFRARIYNYKNHKLAVIFVGKSKKPIRCDNGTYYYREQSQSKPLPFDILEKKFRESFEEEKYLYLIKGELKRIIRYCEDRIWKCQTTVGNCADFDFSYLSKYLLKSGSKLYNFYTENNILGSYSYFIDILTNWLSGVSGTGQFQSFVTFKEQTQNFLGDIERVLKQL